MVQVHKEDLHVRQSEQDGGESSSLAPSLFRTPFSHSHVQPSLHFHPGPVLLAKMIHHKSKLLMSSFQSKYGHFFYRGDPP